MKLEIEVEFNEKRARSDARKTESEIDNHLSKLLHDGLVEDYHITEKIEVC